MRKMTLGVYVSVRSRIETAVKKQYPDGSTPQAGDNTRRISGDVGIRGKIEADFPPGLVEDYKSSNRKTDTRESNRFIVECVTLVFVAIVAVFGAIQTCQSIRSANATRSAADTASKTLEMDRPYVSVELVPTSNLEFTPGGNGYLRIGSTVVNYGRTPALNARIRVQFLSQAKGSPKSETDPNAFCESLQGKGNSSIESIFGGTYLPQVPYKASWIATESETAKVFIPTLIACVAYQSPFSKNWLWTGGMYTIQRARHAKLGGTLLPLRGETVPQKDLVLAPFPNSAISK